MPPQRLREQVALLVAEENGCVYCVSAHTFRGQKLGIDADELLANRRAASADPKMTAALAFARSLLTEKGKVSDALLADTRAAGWDDRALAEIAACGYP
ncbi:carboxymuconolactone decarboxylase family protein [Rhizobium sp. LjRoot30]